MPDEKGTYEQPEEKDESQLKNEQAEKTRDEPMEAEEEQTEKQLEKEYSLTEAAAQPKPEQQSQQKQEENATDLDLNLDLPQRPRSLGSNTIQESADYVLQLLHAYAAAFGL